MKFEKEIQIEFGQAQEVDISAELEKLGAREMENKVRSGEATLTIIEEPVQAVSKEEPYDVVGNVDDKPLWTNSEFGLCRFSFWMARITGEDKKYKLKREFLKKVNTTQFDLSIEKGNVIEVNGAKRSYVYITNIGEILRIKIVGDKCSTEEEEQEILSYVRGAKR